MTTASDLRHRVTLYQRAMITDDFGTTQGDWQEQFTVAANIRPRLGGETVIAARLAGTQPVTITVRQSDQTRTIAPEWRATNARTGTEYNIRSIVDPDEHTPQHGRYIDLLCEAGVAT